MVIQQHKQDFENLYSTILPNDFSIRFPLIEIEKFDWRRGEWANAYYSYHYRRFSSHILSKLSLKERQSILVVGCGFGFDEKNIKSIFADVDLWSVDISEEMLRRAVASQSPSHFSLSMAEKLPFPDNSFDRVVSREVIEHVVNPKAMLREIYRVLKPGGIAVITTENRESLSPANHYDLDIMTFISEYLNYHVTERSYKDNAPSLEEMKAMVRDAGLVLVEHFWDGALYKYLPEMRSILGARMSRVAHYFSRLENNRILAFFFCDQVKYILIKEGDSVSQDTGNPIYYVCIKCNNRLMKYAERYVCSECGQQYPLVNGIPSFIPDQIPDWNGDGPRSNLKQGGKYRTVIFLKVNRLLRAFYCSLYFLIAFLSTFIVKKNSTQLSHILSQDDPYQKYLKNC